MRIWLVGFGVLFALAELYQWFKHLALPLPVYILCGACLAIASNYNKRISLPKKDVGVQAISSSPTPDVSLVSSQAAQQCIK